MWTFTFCRRPALPAIVVLAAAAGAAPAADRVTVRGRVERVDPATRTVTIQTLGSGDVTVTADGRPELLIGGKPATLDQFRPGQRVRATYETAGAVNRLVSLRTAVAGEADLAREVREALRTAGKYTYRQKEQYEADLRRVIDDVDDRIDDLRARAKDANADARKELDRRIGDLETKRKALNDRLDKVSAATERAWDEFKAGVSAAADELRKALEADRPDRK